MQKIIPHLWFDKEAKEASAFYTSVFPESKMGKTATIRNTPSGDCDMVSFKLWNQDFMAISAGPYFKFNPSVSFIVNFDPLLFGASATSNNKAREKLNMVWNKLSEGGKALTPLGEYPFSKHYGWVQDKYGLSWQLILTDPEGEPRPPIVPALMFVGDNYGRAEEAIKFYLSAFKDTKLDAIHRYGKADEMGKEGTVMFADYMLEHTWFAAMDSAGEHKFNFNEAVSFIVNCADQEEIDFYWDKLSAVPEAEQCGWIKDRYGLSWQISSAEIDEMLYKGTQEQADRVTQAFLPMKKLNIRKIKEAYEHVS
jgi:predicted 3-demethylubiquinone-9 3-methyltransferase (glyoxalase superfamily)